MKNKRTLNQTWILCLRMWKKIKNRYVKGVSIHALKRLWLKENGFSGTIRGNCFFCDTAGAGFACAKCPGKLVDHNFMCATEEYDYETKPDLFYKELLRLNRIRKANKPKRPRK